MLVLGVLRLLKIRERGIMATARHLAYIRLVKFSLEFNYIFGGVTSDFNSRRILLYHINLLFGITVQMKASQLNIKRN